MSLPSLPNEILYHIAELADLNTLCVLSRTASIFRRCYHNTITHMTKNAIKVHDHIDVSRHVYNDFYDHGLYEVTYSGLLSRCNYTLDMKHGREEHNTNSKCSELLKTFWFHGKQHGVDFIGSKSFYGTLHLKSLSSWKHGFRHGLELKLFYGGGWCNAEKSVWDMGNEIKISFDIAIDYNNFMDTSEKKIYESYYKISAEIEPELSEPIVRYAYPGYDDTNDMQL